MHNESHSEERPGAGGSSSVPCRYLGTLYAAGAFDRHPKLNKTSSSRADDVQKHLSSYASRAPRERVLALNLQTPMPMLYIRGIDISAIRC
jgi:hypothetical protein